MERNGSIGGSHSERDSQSPMDIVLPEPSGFQEDFGSQLAEGVQFASSYTNNFPTLSPSFISSIPNRLQGFEARFITKGEAKEYPPQRAQLFHSIQEEVEDELEDGEGLDSVQSRMSEASQSYEDEEEESERLSVSPASSSSTSSTSTEPLSLQEMSACCIAEKNADGTYTACMRPNCGIWLSERLRELSIIKRLPFAYNSSRRHYYICLYHRRVIRKEPGLRRGEPFAKRNTSKYEEDLTLTPKELQEVDDDPLLKDVMRYRTASLSSQTDEEPGLKRTRKDGKSSDSTQSTAESDSDEPEYTEERPRRSARNISNGSGTSSTPVANGSTKDKLAQKEKSSGKEVKSGSVKEELASSEELEFDEHDDGEDEDEPAEVPLKVLSATTLRRYKKFFKLSHRSGTNTKQQLLEGVCDHFTSISLPVKDTITYFIYSAKTHRNKLDYPNSSSSTESFVNSGTSSAL